MFFDSSSFKISLFLSKYKPFVSKVQKSITCLSDIHPLSSSIALLCHILQKEKSAVNSSINYGFYRSFQDYNDFSRATVFKILKHLLQTEGADLINLNRFYQTIFVFNYFRLEPISQEQTQTILKQHPFHFRFEHNSAKQSFYFISFHSHTQTDSDRHLNRLCGSRNQFTHACGTLFILPLIYSGTLKADVTARFRASAHIMAECITECPRSFLNARHIRRIPT